MEGRVYRFTDTDKKRRGHPDNDDDEDTGSKTDTVPLGYRKFLYHVYNNEDTEYMRILWNMSPETRDVAYTLLKTICVTSETAVVQEVPGASLQKLETCISSILSDAYTNRYIPDLLAWIRVQSFQTPTFRVLVWRKLMTYGSGAAFDDFLHFITNEMGIMSDTIRSNLIILEPFQI